MPAYLVFPYLNFTLSSSPRNSKPYGRRYAPPCSQLEDILATTTVEGVPTARVAVYYADMCGLELPIFRTAAAVIDGKMDPTEARAKLMNRPLGMEK